MKEGTYELRGHVYPGSNYTQVIWRESEKLGWVEVWGSQATVFYLPGKKQSVVDALRSLGLYQWAKVRPA